MNNEDIRQIAMRQSAIDMNCKPEDFENQGNKVVLSKLNPGAKKCYKNKMFCGLAYYGNGLVASVDEKIEPFIETFIERHSEYRCFDTPQLIVLNEELEKYNQCVCFIAEYFLPDLTKEVLINKDIAIEILEENDIPSLYNDRRFPMALGYDRTSDKKDVLAAVGYVNGKLAGVAGASNDCESMWQIGIDVLPEYRRQEVATTLTKLLTDEIIKHGKVPYYCTAWSNIASKRNAIKCGYRPSWVEMSAIDKKDALEMIGE